MTEQIRDDFEVWAKLKNYDLLKSGGGSYLYVQANIAWKAWQAATKAERERCAKVCEAWNTAHAKATGDCKISDCDMMSAVQDCAAAIRQGGDV